MVLLEDEVFLFRLSAGQSFEIINYQLNIFIVFSVGIFMVVSTYQVNYFEIL